MIARLSRLWHGLRHGHTYAFKCRLNADKLPVPGYKCTECLYWTRSPFSGEVR